MLPTFRVRNKNGMKQQITKNINLPKTKQENMLVTDGRQKTRMKIKDLKALLNQLDDDALVTITKSGRYTDRLDKHKAGMQSRAVCGEDGKWRSEITFDIEV